MYFVLMKRYLWVSVSVRHKKVKPISSCRGTKDGGKRRVDACLDCELNIRNIRRLRRTNINSGLVKYFKIRH